MLSIQWALIIRIVITGQKTGQNRLRKKQKWNRTSNLLSISEKIFIWSLIQIKLKTWIQFEGIRCIHIDRPDFRASPRARCSLFCSRALLFCKPWARQALSHWDRFKAPKMIEWNFWKIIKFWVVFLFYHELTDWNAVIFYHYIIQPVAAITNIA